MLTYIVVCAARNEPNINAHIESLLSQDIPAELILIVDDHSDTPISYPDDRITIERVLFARNYEPGVNQAMAIDFGVAVATKTVKTWDFLLKTDADTILPSNYMSEMINFMKEDPHIGVASGVSSEKNISDMGYRPSDGAKVFTRGCWIDCQGYQFANGFDTFSTLYARYQGYKTATNPNVKFQETRPHSKKTMTAWKWSGRSRKKWGLPWWHTALAALKEIKNGRPFIIGPASMVYHHIKYKPGYTSFPKDWINKFARWEVEQVIAKLKRKIL